MNKQSESNSASPDGANSKTQTEACGQSEKRCRALVVDDSVDITLMLDMILRRAGYDTYTAFTGFDALRAARSSHFDLILSDIGMPLVNGYELCEELRRTAEYRDVPLIAITGYSYYEDQMRAGNCGFDLLLKKPINPSDLIEAIDSLQPPPVA